MFCHTSVQTICHSIGTIFGPRWGPDISSPSGLFTRRCSNPEYGEKLVLYPLHTLVLTAIHLPEGAKDEALFGVLACLLCLLSNGANPLLKAQISSEVLLGWQLTEICTHEELDPAEPASQVPEPPTSKWPLEYRLAGGSFAMYFETRRPNGVRNRLSKITMQRRWNTWKSPIPCILQLYQSCHLYTVWMVQTYMRISR